LTSLSGEKKGDNFLFPMPRIYRKLDFRKYIISGITLLFALCGAKWGYEEKFRLKKFWGMSVWGSVRLENVRIPKESSAANNQAVVILKYIRDR